MRMLTAVMGLLVVAAPGFAAPIPGLPGVSAGVLQSFGTDKYNGTDVYAAGSVGGISIAPEYRRYNMSGLGGARNVLSARVGWDSRWLGLGLSAGGVMRRAGYDAVFGGADVAFTVSPLGDAGIRRIGGSSRGGAPVGKGLARVDFGGGVMATRHRDAATAAAAERKLSQTEMHAFVGASVLDILVSGRVSKFAYDKDLRAAPGPGAVWTPLAGHLSYTNGYADTSVNAGVECPFFPFVAPFASFTYTRYRAQPLTQPGDTKAYTAGIRVGLEMLALEAQFQHVNAAGPDKERNVSGIGAQLRF